MIHLLSRFSTHRVKAAISVLTPHLAKVQIVQRHLQVHSSRHFSGKQAFTEAELLVKCIVAIETNS